ncbi:hypothetical protein B0H63DRAFT_182422 [Podospora didyma]|uniref:Uncharacterized protein n=1 Tax=Podospora didyma TaxID=330526 RepID=A0AAE0TZT1_9PEZI|nr:hypothetical protein B0H63DRAFT_182422 [Podospora didyma]
MSYHSTNRMLRKYRLPREAAPNPQQPTTPESAGSPGISGTFKLHSGSQDHPPGARRSLLTPLTDRGSFASSKSTAASSSRSGSLPTSSAPDDLPPWDRTVDVFWNRRDFTLDNKEWDDELAFQENSARLADQSSIPKCGSAAPADAPGQRGNISRKDNGPYFRLPDRVRFMIAKYVVESHDNGKAVRMNTPRMFDPIWPVNNLPPGDRYWSTDYFDSLKKALVLLRGYTSVCFAMRIDMLTTLFLTRRFHVIYSPLVTETTQPAAVLYMDRFGPYMKWITLEIDLSKFGGHWHPFAAQMDMSKSLVRVYKLVESFAERQLTRRGGVTIQSLAILVRRYYGLRPPVEENSKSTERGKGEKESRQGGEKGDTKRDDKVSQIPYCDDSHLSVLDALKRLEGLVDNMCMVGTSKAYATQFVLAMWGNDRPLTPRDIAKCCHYRCPSSAYPFMPGQSSALDYGPAHGGVKITRHLEDPREWRGLYGCRLSPKVIVTRVPREPPARAFYKLSVGPSPTTRPTPQLPPLPPQSILLAPAEVSARSTSTLPAAATTASSNKTLTEEIENTGDAAGDPRSSPLPKPSPSRIPIFKRRSGSPRRSSRSKLPILSSSPPLPSPHVVEHSTPEQQTNVKKIGKLVKKASREVMTRGLTFTRK